MSAAEEDDDAPKTFLGKIAEFARSWGPAIFAVLFIRTFVFEPFRIPSGSMAPTLQIGDHVAVSKFSYGIWVPATLVEIPFFDWVWVAPRFQLLKLAEPARGDIVVFRYPRAESVNYIKRVVGLPGDRIQVRDNRIWVNGEPQAVSFVDKYDFMEANCSARRMNRHVEDNGATSYHILTNTFDSSHLANVGEKVVPPGQYFMMGDNRDNSEDSRGWGFVRADQIKGKAHVVWLSWDGCKGSFGGIRMDRFFQSLYGL